MISSLCLLVLQDAFIPQDRESGRPRGFAFVTMSAKEGADQAIASLNETDFQVRAAATRIDLASRRSETAMYGSGRSASVPASGRHRQRPRPLPSLLVMRHHATSTRPTRRNGCCLI